MTAGAPEDEETPHRVVALVNPPQPPFELGCAAEVFGTRRPDLPRFYEFRVCTEHPGEVSTTVGYAMSVGDGLSALDAADTIIIPGWKPRDASLSPAVRTALLEAHQRGARIATICTGAFALAQTGLLDGRRATTHWARTAELAERFPGVQVDPGVLYIDHGDVATSAGAGAGIDLCLHLVRRDHGAGRAAAVARYMVMPPHREGGQAQYAAQPSTPALQDSLAVLLEWVTQRLDEPITVEDMAAVVQVSPRTLARRFADQLGVSPGQWLLSRRINMARALLEESDLSIDAIAARVGLASATNLRRRFQRALQTTPAAYRRAFRQTSADRP